MDEFVDQGAAPFEVTGAAGAVVLWHSLLVHTGGRHLGRRPRLAAFARFTRDDEAETARDAATAPFEHWPALDAARMRH